jgi:hypothetical protein
MKLGHLPKMNGTGDDHVKQNKPDSEKTDIMHFL